MISINEKRVDEIYRKLLLEGHPASKANSLAVDLYLKEAILAEKLQNYRMQELLRLQRNTAAQARAQRPRQTAWRTINANI